MIIEGVYKVAPLLTGGCQSMRLDQALPPGAIPLAPREQTFENGQPSAFPLELAHHFELAARNNEGNEREDELELAFHGLILQMTGSPMIAGMQQVLTEFFQAASHDAKHTKPAEDRTVWQHHEIAAAIRDRDIDRARSMMRLHFRGLLFCELARERIQTVD